jgi:hypothetical protein
VLWVLALGLPVAMVAIYLAVATTVEIQDGWAFPLYAGVAASWSIVGAVVASRRPSNAVGWLLWGVGTAISASLLGQVWAMLSDLYFERSLPGTLAGIWLSVLLFPALVAALLLTPLLFPDGRPQSRRWRPVLALALASIAVLTIATMVQPGQLESFDGVSNPLGIAGAEDVTAAVIEIVNVVQLVLLPVCAAAAVIRYRRGSAIDRQQLKWFGSSIVLAIVCIGGAVVLPQPAGQLAWIAMTVSVALVPVSIGIAILRYRLFEIDRIVGRTVAYAIITAVLAAAFVATNLVLQAVLADATGSSTIITATATLLVAALFQPLRRRVQRAVDARFNRRRLDADRLSDRFAALVRDQVDLERLRGAMVGIVDDAVAPTGTALWLRRGAR